MQFFLITWNVCKKNTLGGLTNLENKETNQPSYSHGIQNGNPNDNISLSRIERLEFLSSKDERQDCFEHYFDRLHPSIDHSHDSLNDHIKDFLCRTMKMNPREIDTNLYARKSPRLNTVLIKFSDKKQNYSAWKKLRNREGDTCCVLYT